MLLFGSKFLSDKQLLEDTIQELFIELWQSKSQTPVVTIKAYLLKSLKYKLLKAIKKNTAAAILNEQDHLLFEWSHENFLIESQESEEKKQLVLKAVAQLSNRQQEIIYLKYYQNLSYAEVSEIMSINYQVARNLLSQAVKTLKKILLPALFVYTLLS
jgi:RNA polymerase sigma factor (sigma-70 family)